MSLCPCRNVSTSVVTCRSLQKRGEIRYDRRFQGKVLTHRMIHYATQTVLEDVDIDKLQFLFVVCVRGCVCVYVYA